MTPPHMGDWIGWGTASKVRQKQHGYIKHIYIHTHTRAQRTHKCRIAVTFHHIYIYIYLYIYDETHTPKNVCMCEMRLNITAHDQQTRT